MNTVAWSYHSTQALPFTTVILILFIWLISELTQCVVFVTRTHSYTHTHTCTHKQSKHAAQPSGNSCVCMCILLQIEHCVLCLPLHVTVYRVACITLHYVLLHLLQLVTSHFITVGFPLTIFGGIFGKNMASTFDAPCRTKNIAREIPSVPWYAHKAKLCSMQYVIFVYVETSACITLCTLCGS